MPGLGSGRGAGDALCPFFKGYQVRFIVCEAPVEPAVSVRIVFFRRTESDMHFKTYCASWNYERCPMYRAILKKYDE